MANATYEVILEKLEAIECDYFPTLEKYKKTGDVDVFTDFGNRVIDLWNELKELPENDEYFDILQKVLYYRSIIDDLTH